MKERFNGSKASGLLFTGDILRGNGVRLGERRIGDLGGVFSDESARSGMDQQAVVYSVSSFEPVPHGTEGGLFFGITQLSAGTVGREFYMTKGHFHEKRNRAEYYWCIGGDGLIVLFDGSEAWTEELRPGSLHYIPGDTAHRLVNVGLQTLSVGACWPSDAGHDYEAIPRHGFPLRVYSEGGVPSVVAIDDRAPLGP